MHRDENRLGCESRDCILRFNVENSCPRDSASTKQTISRNTSIGSLSSVVLGMIEAMRVALKNEKLVGKFCRISAGNRGPTSAMMALIGSQKILSAQIIMSSRSLNLLKIIEGHRRN